MADHATVTPQQLASVIDGKLLKRIPYMDKPPAMGGQLTYLSHEEFYAKFGCHYYEGLKISQYGWLYAINLYRILPSIFSLVNDPELNSALDRLKNPLDCLAICNMGEPVGHGLFALKNIRMGTVICIYSGTAGPVSVFSKYAFKRVDAEEIGGISRFMQHMPLSKTRFHEYLLAVMQGKFFPLSEDNLNTIAECKEYLRKKDHLFDFDKIMFVNDDIKESVATSNVTFNTIRMLGAEFIIMCAMRDIQKNEAIGFSYGLDYWKNPQINHSPLLFTKQGQIIPTENTYVYPESLIKPAHEIKLFDHQFVKYINYAWQNVRDNPLKALALATVAYKTGALEAVLPAAIGVGIEEVSHVCAAIACKKGCTIL